MRMIVGFLIGAFICGELAYWISDVLIRNGLLFRNARYYDPHGIGEAYAVVFVIIPVAAGVGGIAGAVIAYVLGR